MNKQNEDLPNRSNIVDINIDPWFLHLIQINDTAFPTGGYAHSFGMETYIQEDRIRSEEDLKQFCDMYIRHNLASTDAIIVKEAYELATKQDIAGLLHLEKICHAIKLSPETRQGSTMMGRQFLQTVLPLAEDKLLMDWNKKLKDKEINCHYPIIYGIYTAIQGMDKRKALEAFLYSSVTALVQNAVRAVPLGQQSGVKTVFSLLPIMQETVRLVERRNLDDLDNNSVALEISSINHEFLYSRLFIS